MGEEAEADSEGLGLLADATETAGDGADPSGLVAAVVVEVEDGAAEPPWFCCCC